MVFNSGIYFYFLFFVLAIYFALCLFKEERRLQNRFLLFASYIFYGWWDWIFLSLIIISTIVDYLTARQIEKSQNANHRKVLLTISVLINLGMLGVFKYFDFFVKSFVGAVGMIAPEYIPDNTDFLLLKVILPVGISFYTFQTMSYTIDVYRNQIPAEKNFLDFSLFVAFFPQLVAGPIERAGDLIPQFKNRPRPTLEDIKAGAWLILYGLFMKTFVADSLAPIADSVFMPTRSAYLANVNYLDYFGGLQVFLGCVAFTFQIYGDFAGYSTIALGTARLLGIRLTLNFNTPFFSSNPAEFWRRWHVTLNRWVTDYVYIPLGGSRIGEFRKYRNLLFVFVLTGLWHGANWTYVAWGASFGVWMVIYLLWMPYFKKSDVTLESRAGKFKRFNMIALCFIGTVLTTPLFRAWDISQSFDMYARIFMFPWEMAQVAYASIMDVTLSGVRPWGMASISPDSSKMAVNIIRYTWLLVAVDFMWFRKDNVFWLLERPLWQRVGIYSLLYFLILTMGVFGKDVIYFAF